MGKFIDPKQASTYALVHRSVEDPNYEDETTARTLVHCDRNRTKREGGAQRDVLHEDMKNYEYDMQNPDDDVNGLNDELFDGEMAMEDFDQDFIQEMMDPDPNEEEIEVGPDDYEKHEIGAGMKMNDLDAEFSALMTSEYKARDMEIEENDPRAEGFMQVDAYVPIMQEFVQGYEKGHMLEENRHHDRFVDRLQPTGDEVFHEQGQGRFYTAIASKKDIDIVDDYHGGMDGARKIALDRLQHSEKVIEERIMKGELPEDAEENTADMEYEYVKLKFANEERVDCMTIHTTQSTLENHPAIIAAEKGRIRINKRTGALIKMNKLTSKSLGKLGEASALDALKKDQVAAPGSDAGSEGAAPESAQDDRESVGESLITVIDTTVKRCKNETPEEKRARKQAVKDEKAQKRTEKKNMKVAYKAETLRQRHVNPKAKQQMAELSLR